MSKTCTAWDENQVPFYHYTSLETLYKILASGKLRLTACNNLKNAAVETMALEIALKKFINKYPENKDKESIQKYLEGREKSYMACFSKKCPDSINSDILWKYYADNNKGVAIEFDYEKFPYTEHGSRGTQKNNIMQRDTEFRLFSMMYDEEKFIDAMKKFADTNLYVISTDSYKPQFCSTEEEIRLIVFLNEISDVNTLKWEIDQEDSRSITISEYNSDHRPAFLYYDIISKDGSSSAIKKVLCKNKETHCKLKGVFSDDKMCELLK